MGRGRVTALLAQACSRVAGASRFVHGDVKPENFVVSQARGSGSGQRARLLLLDLGLAQGFRHRTGREWKGYHCEPDVFRCAPPAIPSMKAHPSCPCALVPAG